MPETVVTHGEISSNIQINKSGKGKCFLTDVYQLINEEEI
jgi:hypothetical protein